MRQTSVVRDKAMMLTNTLRFAAAALCMTSVLALAQDQAPTNVLTLDQAVQMAKNKNGDVRAAVLSEKIARARVDGARAEFFPTITPSYTYNSRRVQLLNPTGGGKLFTQSEGGTTTVNATWRLLDFGERGFNLSSATEEARAAEADSLQTLRQVLFQVYSTYYNTLRSQELVTAAAAQVTRAQSIYDATAAQVEVGQTAKKDLLQAQADLANSRVQQFAAQNAFSNAQASLKALIGMPSTTQLPSLVSSTPPSATLELPTLDDMIQAGMQNREDLISARKRTNSLKYSAQSAQRQATASVGLDATFTQELTPNTLQDRAFVLSVSLPWLDFGRSKAQAREAKFSYEASKSSLVQTERTAQAEIESAYQDVKQNAERLKAAQEAIDAAKQNFDAAAESQKLGVGTVVDVITAQASLATAESDYVQALYDYDTSVVQLRLVTGQSIPGEEAARQ